MKKRELFFLNFAFLIGFLLCAVRANFGSNKPTKTSFKPTDEQSLFQAIELNDIAKVKHGVQKFQDAGTHVDDIHYDARGETPLHRAAWTGCVGIVELLLGCGATINVKDVYGNTPLHAAADQGLKEGISQQKGETKEGVVRLLLDRGADVNARNGVESTPLHAAVSSTGPDENSIKKVVEFLLSRGAKVDARNTYATTPFYIAAYLGRIDIAQLLLDHGADIDPVAKDKTSMGEEDGWTPLHWTARCGHEEMVKFLLDHKANKDARDSRGRTPLHLAAQFAYAEVAKLLLERGADKEARDNNDRTPLQLAMEGEETGSKVHGAVVAVLQGMPIPTSQEKRTSEKSSTSKDKPHNLEDQLPASVTMRRGAFLCIAAALIFAGRHVWKKHKLTVLKQKIVSLRTKLDNQEISEQEYEQLYQELVSGISLTDLKTIENSLLRLQKLKMGAF